MKVTIQNISSALMSNSFNRCWKNFGNVMYFKVLDNIYFTILGLINFWKEFAEFVH